MKKHIKHVITCVILLVCVNLNAQYKYAAPNGTDDIVSGGTEANPWDLQTALSELEPGDTLWLRDGDYTDTGTYVTNGAHGTAGHPITIASYPGEWARLNGNVICTKIVGADDPDDLDDGEEPDPGSVTCEAVLNVNKNYYIFKNFEITMISDDDPNTIDDNFSRYRGNYTTTVASQSSNPESYPFINRTGISHTNGIHCKFINLIIHNLGGNGIGSWRATGGSKIYGCLIYNNGDQAIRSNGLPGSYPVSGSGIYMQNETELWKNINNNIFFNNFKVAAKLWSASKIAPHVDFLKNVNFNNNVVLNTGSALHPTVGKECFIAAGASEIEGEGIVHDVNIERNFMYHNQSSGYNEISGNYDIAVEVLLLGTEISDDSMVYNRVNNVKVFNNYLIGRKQGLRFVRVENLEFKRNIVKTNYVFMLNNVSNLNHNGFNWSDPGVINNYLTWSFNANKYFSDGDPDTFRLGRVGAVGASGRRTLQEVRGVQSLPIGPGPGTHPVALDFESDNSTDQNHGNFFNEMPSIVNNYNIYDNEYNVISITQNEHKPNEFKIVVFDYNGGNVKVNLEDYSIPDGLPYTIRDAENYFTEVDDPGNIGNIYNGVTNTIVLPMSLPEIDVPNGHYPAKDDWNIAPRKSDIQIGVFIVEFDVADCELYYLLQGFSENNDTIYLAEDNITTGEDPITELPYVIEENAKVTHKAGTNIVLKAGTQIKPRIDADHPYLAKIEPCSSSNSGLEYTGETYLNPEPRKSISQRKANEKLNKIKVYPNPATTKVTVHSLEDMSSILLANTIGRTVLEAPIHHNSLKAIDLNLSGIPSGMYFLRITLTTGEIITKQVVKK